MSNLKRSNVLKGLLCFGVLSLMASNANAISIDNWSVDSSAEANYGNPQGRKAIQNDQYTTIIGRARRVIANYTSTIDYDSNGVKIATFTSLNMLSHSQAKKVSGYTTVIWDGNVNPSYIDQVDSTGLGGINFTTDGSTKFIITVDDEEEEFRKRDNAYISLTVYKYNSTQAYEVKKYAKDVTDRTSDSFDLEFLFSEFGYDFKDVGALVLKIDGQEYEAMDVSLGEIKTDGCQGFVPEPDYGYVNGWESTISRDNGDAMTLLCCQESLIDECGICNGTGKDVCGFCPDNQNYNLGKNECGICPGQPNYDLGKNECGFCPSDPEYLLEKDDCGLCPGDSSYNQKDSCGFCPGTEGYSKGKDTCGFCYGTEEYIKGKDACLRCPGDPNYGNKECEDCDLEKAGIQTKDRCDRCLDLKDPKRDSCLDCDNEPWGKKQIDDCGDCKDPYASDWNSGADAKYGCTVTTHSNDLQDTENWISQQQTNYKSLLNNRHYCKTEKEKKKLRTKSVQILNSVKATINNYPTSTSSCEVYDADHCTSYSLKGDNNELTESVKKLRKRSLKALNARKNCIGNERGTCEGSYDECLKRMRNRYRQIREERRNVEKLAKNAKNSINKLPKIASACSCESK